jgi:hypothetical protein
MHSHLGVVCYSHHSAPALEWAVAALGLTLFPIVVICDEDPQEHGLGSAYVSLPWAAVAREALKRLRGLASGHGAQASVLLAPPAVIQA